MKKILTVCFIFNMFFAYSSKAQGITPNDILIAQDSIHSVTFDEQTVWKVRRMVMEKLLADTSLISTDTAITRFYNEQVNGNIGKLSKVRLAINALYPMDSLKAVVIQGNLDSIHSNAMSIAYQDSILANDTTLSGADSLAIDSLIQLYNDNIAGYAAINDSVYTIVQTAMDGNITIAKSMNDTMASDKIYEQNEIETNDIFLSTIAIGRMDSVSYYETELYNIAKQCPLRGGPGVYYARSMYHLLNDTIIYDDDRMCNSPSDTCLVPPTPGLISGRSAGVCDRHLMYSIDTVITATSYTWSVSGGAVIDSGQGSLNVYVSFPDTFITGIISVYASDSCGAGAARSMGIRGYPHAADSIIGPSAICSFISEVPFSVDSVAGATSYTWVLPPGCTIDSGQGKRNIFATWDSLPGNVLVVATNDCGSSDTTAHYVDIIECRLSKNIKTSSGSGIKVYPNPTTGKVSVIYHVNSPNGMLQLFDITGRLMGNYKLNENISSFEFDAGYLCCGVFEYRVLDNNTVKGQGKLVIIR